MRNPSGDHSNRVLATRTGNNVLDRVAVELADSGDVGILVFRHSFSDADKIPFRELERTADAFRAGLRNVIRLGGLLGC